MRWFAGVLVTLIACGSFDAASTPAADGGGADAQAEGGGGPADAGGTAKLVFVAAAPLTSTQAQKADQVCDALIKQVSPTRRALAWIYIDSLSPLQRLGSAEGPWATPTGRPVFANRAALTSGAPSNPMDESVDGRSLAGQKVWTGLEADGGPSGLDCRRWVSEETTDEATMGLTSAATASWANSHKELCAGRHPVLCFEY